MIYLKWLALVIVLSFVYQLYKFAGSRAGVERQQSCRALGIFLFSVGAACLVGRSLLWTVAGLVLMMFGFRLIARGLDRLDKKIFIDRYHDDEKRSR